MNLKAFVIKQYVNHDEIEHIIGHDILVYIKTAIKHLAILVMLLLIYRVVRLYIDRETATLVFGVAGLMTYAFFVMRILNDYFDAMLITKHGITILTRNGFLQYKTESIYRENIETITYEQSGIIDAARNVGDIVIRLERDITFPFHHVPQPKKQAAIVAAWKEKSFGPSIVMENE
ncbi:hypothetical protein KBC03_05750 [Patescibacteria group bacterium]|nr:hypothetical protein [Patescibacteria group bacterium]